MVENTKPPIVKVKKLKTLLALIENAVKIDNYFFRNLYAEIDGKEVDILQDGLISCAAFSSAVLLNLELIKKPHATVGGTEKDMLESGWYEIKELRPGAVVIWEKVKFDDGKEHRHLGFCLNENEAVSNSAAEGFPRKHHIAFNGTRKIEKILWHTDLDQG